MPAALTCHSPPRAPNLTEIARQLTKRCLRSQYYPRKKSACGYSSSLLVAGYPRCGLAASRRDYGNGAQCSACNVIIDAPKKANLKREGAPDKQHALSFHFACYVIWQRECSKRMTEDATSSLGASGSEKEAQGPISDSAARGNQLFVRGSADSATATRIRALGGADVLIAILVRPATL
jgi:hypothetical protein